MHRPFTTRLPASQGPVHVGIDLATHADVNGPCTPNLEKQVPLSPRRERRGALRWRRALEIATVLAVAVGTAAASACNNAGNACLSAAAGVGGAAVTTSAVSVTGAGGKVSTVVQPTTVSSSGAGVGGSGGASGFPDCVVPLSGPNGATSVVGVTSVTTVVSATSASSTGTSTFIASSSSGFVASSSSGFVTSSSSGMGGFGATSSSSTLPP